MKDVNNEYIPRWIFGKQENYRYASYFGDKLGVFIFYGLRQFGFGFDFYYHILSKGEKRVPKLLIYLPFMTINLTLHLN